MQKQIVLPLLLFGLFVCNFTQAQVKIGDNPQTIDPTSILELESSERVLVITRVDSLQMTTIVPNRGALVYNTTAECVFYYDGTQWNNLCGATGIDNGLFTTDAIVNEGGVPTIVITPTAEGNNFEVANNSITTDQIVNGSIFAEDLNPGAFDGDLLVNNSVTQEKLSENSVGVFALDESNIDLSDFTNTTGFITSASIISGDANNAITAGGDNGAFYDDSALETAIAINTTAIGNDEDQSITNEIQNLELTGNRLSLTGTAGFVDLPTADGSDTQINPTGTNITVTGDGTAANPYTINAANEVDGNITNELQDLSFDAGTNILTITNPATAGNEVDLSALVGGGGGGSTELADGTTILGTGAAADRFRVAPGTDGQFLTTDAGGNVAWATVTPGGGTPPSFNTTFFEGDGSAATPYTLAPGTANQILRTNAAGDAVAWVDFPTGTGGSQNLSGVLTEGNDANANGITNLTTDGTDDTAAATVGFVNAAVTAGGTLTDGSILVGGTGDAAQQLEISGDATMDNAGVLTIEEGAVDSDKILDASITLADLNDNGATVDGEIMQWDTTANSGAGGWVIAENAAGLTGEAKSIFFAGADGNPDQAFHPTNGNPSFIWDYDARVVSGIAYGALGIGLDGNPIATNVKTHIQDIVEGDISYPLQIHNRSSSGATGIIFSVIGGTATYGKGVLAFERNGGSGIGDFHFLQNTETNNSTADLDDKNFTIKSNGDIRLYGGIDVDGTPTGLGTAGQVLKSTGAGVEWGAAGGGGSVTTDTSLNGDGSGAANALGVADNGITSLKILDGEVQTDDIADANITLAKIQPLTPAPATNQMLITNTTGDVAWAPVSSGSGTTELADQVTITGNGQAGTEFQVPEGGITSTQIANGTIALVDLSDMGAADGQVLKWNGTTSIWEPAADNGGSTAFTGGEGLTLTGNDFSVNVDEATIEIDTDILRIKDGGVTNTKLDKANIPLSGFGAADADVALGGFKITDLAIPTLDQDAATKKYVDDNAGSNLSNSNLEQTEAIRTYEVETGESLVFTGLGNVGFGNGANPPLSKFHFAGEVRVEGINSAGGSVGAPAYSFTTGDDTNTGMYRPAADEIGFSVGGEEALRVEEDGGNTNVIINQSLQLDGVLLDEDGNAGPADLVLTSTGTGVKWLPGGGGATVDTNPLKITGDGSTGNPLTIANDAIGSGELAGNAVTTANIAVKTILSDDIGDGEIKPINIEPQSINASLIITGGVETDEILNGTILNVDIDPAAAIEGSKINPDFGGQDIATTGAINATGDITTDGDFVDTTPDYVFQKYFNGFSELNDKYRFQSLEEIGTFIKNNHHLPGIKSAKEIKKQGYWSLTEASQKNLEKIEELYLHTIDQEKKIKKLQSEKETLSEELIAIKKDLAEIKALLKK